MKIDLELRGDDIKLLQQSIKYIPVDREDILSLICYYMIQISEQSEQIYKTLDDLTDDELRDLFGGE